MLGDRVLPGPGMHWTGPGGGGRCQALTCSVVEQKLAGQVKVSQKCLEHSQAQGGILGIVLCRAKNWTQ